MKNIIATLFLTVISASSFADDDESLCQSWKETAKVIMEERQLGVEYSSMYAVAAKIDANHGTNTQKHMVDRAYLYPRVFDPQAREAIISNFQNEIYNICKSN